MWGNFARIPNSDGAVKFGPIGHLWTAAFIRDQMILVCVIIHLHLHTILCFFVFFFIVVALTWHLFTYLCFGTIRCGCSHRNILANHFVGNSCWVMEAQFSSSSSSSCARVRWLTIDYSIPHHHRSQSGKMGDTRPQLSSPAPWAVGPHHHLLLRCSDLRTRPTRSSSSSFQYHHPLHRPEERGCTITTLAVSMRVVLYSVQMACLTCSSCFAMPKTCKPLVLFVQLQKGACSCSFHPPSLLL